MKYLFPITAFVVLLASPSLSIAVNRLDEGVSTSTGRFSCATYTEEIICKDNPACQWNVKKSKCQKTTAGSDPCLAHSEFYCEVNKCHWHRQARVCGTNVGE